MLVRRGARLYKCRSRGQHILAFLPHLHGDCSHMPRAGSQTFERPRTRAWVKAQEARDQVSSNVALPSSARQTRARAAQPAAKEAHIPAKRGTGSHPTRERTRIPPGERDSRRVVRLLTPLKPSRPCGQKTLSLPPAVLAVLRKHSPQRRERQKKFLRPAKWLA